MSLDEYNPLLLSSLESSDNSSDNYKRLSLFFAVICVIDVFGVFPIVALPKAVLQCGWLGIPLILFVFSIQISTAILLGKCWTIAEYLDKSIIRKSRYPYAAIAEMTFGRNLAIFVTILLDFTIFAGSIPNIIVAAQNLEILGTKISNNNFNFSHCYWMVLLGIILCPLLWFGSPKDMKILCCISVIVVVSISGLIWTCIYYDNLSDNNVSPELVEESLLGRLISTYGIIAFQFDVHPVLLTIQVDMKNKNQMPYAVFLGFLTTIMLFIITTVFAAFKYSLSTYDNILQGLPPSFTLYISVFLVTMQLCLTCAVCNSAFYQHIEDYLDIPREFNYKRCILRSILTALAVLVAESVPKFDIVMSLIGGTLIGPLMFIFPPLFYTKMMLLKKNHLSNLSLQNANHFMYHCRTNFLDSNICNDRCISYQTEKFPSDNKFYLEIKDDNCFVFKLVLTISIVIFGIFATVSTTYISFKKTVNYVSFLPSCLYNVTFLDNISL